MKIECPSCMTDMDCHECVNEQVTTRLPTTGDVLLCAHCATVSIIDANNEATMATEDDIEAMGDDFRFMVERCRELVKSHMGNR